MTEPRPRVIAQGRYLRLLEEGGWEYAERVGASGVVAVVALTPAMEVVLVEQYRRPVKRRVLELPAGLAGDVAGQEGEDFSRAAARELEEETGFRAAAMELITSGPSASGSSSTIMHFYLATGLERVGPGGGDEHEDIQVHVVPLKECHAFVKEKVRQGCLADPKLFAGLYFAHRRSEA